MAVAVHAQCSSSGHSHTCLPSRIGKLRHRCHQATTREKKGGKGGLFAGAKVGLTRENIGG